jgi:hypothetical protein
VLERVNDVLLVRSLVVAPVLGGDVEVLAAVGRVLLVGHRLVRVADVVAALGPVALQLAARGLGGRLDVGGQLPGVRDGDPGRVDVAIGAALVVPAAGQRDDHDHDRRERQRAADGVAHAALALLRGLGLLLALEALLAQLLLLVLAAGHGGEG